MSTHPAPHDPTSCPDWCPPGCAPITLPDLVETVRIHRVALNTVQHAANGRPLVQTSLSRLDDVDSGQQGQTTIGLNMGPDHPTYTIGLDQARALSDALDYAVRVTADANDGTCDQCDAAWPSTSLDDSNVCPSCIAQDRRLRLVRDQGMTVGRGNPEPFDRVASSVDQPATLARFGDASTNVEVRRQDGTSSRPPRDLIRLRLGSAGYMTAQGARRLATYLTDAAHHLDQLMVDSQGSVRQSKE